MTIDNKILPAHILRLFVWELLKLNAGLEPVNGLIPLVPIEDEPTLAESGEPYLIYGYAEMEAERRDINRRGVLSFRIVAPTSAQLGQISNVISSAFESRDVATEAVNRWSSTNDQLVGIRFTSLKTTYVERGEAAESEGGPVDTVVNIGYEYITDVEIAFPTASGNGLWT